MNKLLQLILFALLLVAVFDPGDQVTHLKVPLFVGLWVIFFVGLLISKERIPTIAPSLLMYIFVFALFLPLVSILWYYVRGGHAASFDGFQYLKSFLFLTLAAVLVAKKIDAIRLLNIVLTLLSFVIIVTEILISTQPGLIDLLWPIGDAYDLFSMGERTYGGFSYYYVYPHTAPLLVLSLAYFAYRSATSKSRARYLHVALLLVNVVAMLCSGTRNDMIFALITPLLVFIWYSDKNQRRALFALLLVGAVTAGIYASDIIRAMADPDNESNAIRLMHLRDYSMMFSDPKTLLFGQGLGSYFYSSGFGTETSITELTYLEFIRNFGLIIAIIYYGLLLYPIRKLRNQTFKEMHFLILAYVAYLMICVSNPLLVSSSGMLVLAIVISKVFSDAESSSHAVRRAVPLRQQPA